MDLSQAEVLFDAKGIAGNLDALAQEIAGNAGDPQT